MVSTVCLHEPQKKTPLRLGVAQITPPAACSLGNFFTFVYALKIKSVEINLGRGCPPPARYLGNFFTLESVKNNLGSGFSPKWTMPKRKVVFLGFLPLHPPQLKAKHFRNFTTSMRWCHLYVYTPFIFFSQSFKKNYLLNPNCTRPAQTDFGAKAVWEKSLTFKLNRRSPLVYSLNHQLKNSQTFIKYQIFHI